VPSAREVVDVDIGALLLGAWQVYAL